MRRFMRELRAVVLTGGVAASLFLVAGCGGGGSSPSPTGTSTPIPSNGTPTVSKMVTYWNPNFNFFYTEISGTNLEGSSIRLSFVDPATGNVVGTQSGLGRRTDGSMISGNISGNSIPSNNLGPFIVDIYLNDVLVPRTTPPFTYIFTK